MTTYKFDSENAYQLWCQNKINAIYYANIAMNNQKITETVQEIAHTLHCSEHERLVKPEPNMFILEYSTGEYDEYRSSTQPMKWFGTKESLDTHLRELYSTWKQASNRIAWNDRNYDKKHDNACKLATVECEGTSFCVASLHDSYSKGIQYLRVYEFDEWVKEHG